MRYKTARRLLLFWTMFIGIGALAGGAWMLIRPDGALGMEEMLPYFQVLPFADVLFQDFLFSGIALIIVNGLTNLTAAVLLLKNKRAGCVLGGVFGVTLMLWICIQFYMFPANFMSTIYFVFGALQAVTGFGATVFYDQEHFTVRPEDYPNIGSDKSRLVVYFSRMGYVERAALSRANETGAEVFRLESTELTKGTLGFWWCGRFGMHRWDMPLKAMPENIERYEHVTICTPVWVFALSAPMRSFCREMKGRIKSADYVIVHFQRGRYASVAREMDGLLGIRGEGTESICSRWGRVKKIYKF